MALQLTTNEQARIDAVVRKRGGTPMDALHAVRQARDHKAADLSNKTTIRRDINGETRPRGRKEKRGRSPKKDDRTLKQTRKSLVQEATHALAMCRASQRGPTCDQPASQCASHVSKATGQPP